jgi:hypothetical protein
MKSVLKMARVRQGVCVLGVTLGVLLCSLPLFSQGSNGRILGTVMDQTGGVISGATVTIIDKDRGVARTLTTDDAGEYNAPQLVPSTYIVRAEAKGFKKLERQNVVLEVGKEVRIDLTVQPGEQTQTVTVTEAIPLVETTNATLGGTLSNAEVVDLPLNGRLYQNLLSLRPGIVTQPGGTAWTQSTNGGRPDQTVWMVDGVINTGFYDATPLNGRGSPFTDGATIVPIDAIQEFTMEESPKAEYGWKPGAVVNVGIRSGTNNLHGTAYAFGRSNAFDARNLFNPGPDASGNCVPNPQYAAQCNKLPTEFKQFGATVGGPIKKDKLFFFGAYEGLRSFVGNVFIETIPAASAGLGPTNSMPDAIKALQTAGVPLSPVSLAIFGCTPTAGVYSCTGAGPNSAYGIQHAPSGTNSYQSNFPNRNTSDNGVGKLEYRPNSKNLMTGLVMVSNYSSLGEDHPITNFNFENSVPIRTYTGTGNWIYTPGSSVVNDFRISYARYNFCLCNSDLLLADGVNYPLNTGVTSTPGFPSIYFGNGFGAAGGFVLGTWGNRPGPINKGNPYYDLQDSVSYLRGKHSLKFGVEYAHIEADLYSPGTRGRINFSGNVKILGTPGIAKGASALEDFFAGLPGKKGGAAAGTLLVNPKPLRFLWKSTSVFAQDDWRLTPRLMINLGLRYSYTSPFKEANGLIANFDPTSPTGLVQQGSGVGQVDSLIKPDKLNFSPRLGFAWDVTGKGTTVVRGGGSIIYSQWQIASMFGNPGPSGDSNHQSSPANNPSGFTCPAGTPGCPNGTFGGTINTGVLQLTGANIPWNSPVGLPGGAGILSAVLGLPPNCNPTAPTNIATSTGSIGGCDLFALDPNMKNAYVLSWSLGVTHAFTSNTSLEVGYVGNRGVKLSQLRDINACEVVNGVTTNPCVQPYGAQFPYFDVINYASDNAHSSYNSLQSTLTQRVAHGLSFTGGYTYSHALDNGSLSRFGGLPQNQYAPLAEYASSDLDLRHRFTLSGTYALPGKKGFGQMLEGWSINTVLSLQTGLPWLPIDTSNNFANDTPRGHGGEQTQRWDFSGNPADFKSGSSSLPYCTGPVAGGCTVTSGVSGLVTSFDANQSTSMWNQCLAHAADPTGTLVTGGCFDNNGSVMTPPAQNHFGNMGRNTFRDLGFKDWDLSLFKNFRFTERLGAQFRVEVFNVLNHPILANPYGAAPGGVGADPSTTGTFGCGCATPDVGNGNAVVGSGGPRVMQLGLKLNF